MQTKSIGILGGTFDPIHHGHLRCALEMYQILGLQEVRFLPCNKPVHKNDTLSNAVHRLNMLRLAIANVDGLSIDDREIIRETPSYMIETLQSLRREFPETGLCLILGTDAFMQLHTWQSYEKILDLAHIVVALRPGHELLPTPETKKLLTHQVVDFEDLHQQNHGNVYLQIITQLEIASTDIRSQIKAGYNPSYLIPVNVWEYIQENRLYL